MGTNEGFTWQAAGNKANMASSIMLDGFGSDTRTELRMREKIAKKKKTKPVKNTFIYSVSEFHFNVCVSCDKTALKLLCKY